MSDNRKPVYKNMHTVKSFSEQRAATVQVMERICENEEYLYQKSNRLEYLSPPAMRKRFNPVLVDPDKSHDYMITEDVADGSKILMFNSNLTHLISIDFNDMSLIDTVNSTVAFETYTNNTGVHQRAILPHKTASSLNSDCKNFDNGDGINSYWYVGFDKNQPYQIRPDWIVNPFDPEIPSICRAQTIVIPEGIQNNNVKSSYLESVSLFIESQGVNSSDWASPLYVQLWNVEFEDYPKTEYSNNQNVEIGGKETVYKPVGTPDAPLATAIFNPNETTPGFYNFVFDKPVKVNGGEHYAIVVLSPLSNWNHCPRVGGWGRNCLVAKDNGGDAFLSENNGRSWIRYGKNDDKLTWNDYS